MSLTSTDFQGIAKERRPVPGKLWHVSAAGGDDNLNDGLSWVTPFATLAKATAAVTGSGTQDGIIAAGVFDLATSHLVCPSNLVLLEGLGMDSTIIKSQISGASVIRLCSGLRIANLTVWGNATPANGVFQYPISDDFSAFTGVVLENIRTIGDTDGIYLPGGSQVRAIRTRHTSNWDCAYVAAGGLLELIDPIFDTIAQNAASPNANSTIQAADGAVIRIVRGAASNVAGNTNASRATFMMHARNTSLPGARIELHGGSVYLNVDGTTQLNLVADTACSIVDGGAAFDRTKTSGPVTVLPLYANGPVTGPGPFPMTVHVQDGNGVAIAGARVTINGTGNSGSTITDGSGNASLSLAAGTVTISAAATGYAAFVPVTDTINSSGQWTSDSSATRTIVLNAISYSTPAPGQTTVYLTTRDQTGTAKSGVIVQFQLTAPPVGASGDAFDQTIKQITSDVNGLVQIALPSGATVDYWTIKGRANTIIVRASGPFALPDLVGSYTA